MNIFIIVSEWKVGADNIEVDVIATTRTYGREPYPYFTSIDEANDFIKSLNESFMDYRALEVSPQRADQLK